VFIAEEAEVRGLVAGGGVVKVLRVQVVSHDMSLL
jgi:hypothetical protein